VICVHGLTRNAHDFDYLAQYLVEHNTNESQSVRVIAVDVPGRGESDWLLSPMHYAVCSSVS
jgi:pimeloyl-ACP methyl ester carboxylesterase